VALDWARLIAGGFGCGLVPRGQGSVGSLVAVVVGAGLLWLSHWAVAVAALLAAWGGLRAVEAIRAEDDPGWVVIDEIAGQWIALLALPRPSPAGLASAFVLFRLLDIAKPGPIGWADRQRGAFAIMGDDLLAGAITAVLLLIARAIWPGAFD
jgi:phosphatidylglycerophosphatase A